MPGENTVSMCDINCTLCTQRKLCKHHDSSYTCTLIMVQKFKHSCIYIIRGNEQTYSYLSLWARTHASNFCHCHNDVCTSSSVTHILTVVMEELLYTLYIQGVKLPNIQKLVVLVVLLLLLSWLLSLSLSSSL